MSPMRLALTIGFLIASIPFASSAQPYATALEEAKARLACGTGNIVSAQRLADGSIKVGCEEAPLLTGLSGNAQTTFLVVLTAITFGVLLGGEDGVTTTTTARD